MNNKPLSKLESTKKAIKITEDIFSSLIYNFSKFSTELDIYNFILNEIKKRKLKPSFDPLVINSNFTKIHRSPLNKKLKRGFLILDFGVRYNNYCSDFTRTLFLGKPNNYELKLYNLVKQALKYAEKSILLLKPNELDQATRNYFKGYKKYFIHSLGHGTGRKIHQRPFISYKRIDYFKDNSIFTLEPGLYFKKSKKEYGIRIENQYYISKKICNNNRSKIHKNSKNNKSKIKLKVIKLNKINDDLIILPIKNLNIKN